MPWRLTLGSRKFLKEFTPKYHPPKQRSILEAITHLAPTPSPDDNASLQCHPRQTFLKPHLIVHIAGKTWPPLQPQPRLTWRPILIHHCHWVHQVLPHQPQVMLNHHWNPQPLTLESTTTHTGTYTHDISEPWQLGQSMRNKEDPWLANSIRLSVKPVSYIGWLKIWG